MLAEHPAKEIWLNVAQVVSIEEVFNDGSREPLPKPENGSFFPTKTK